VFGGEGLADFVDGCKFASDTWRMYPSTSNGAGIPTVPEPQLLLSLPLVIETFQPLLSKFFLPSSLLFGKQSSRALKTDVLFFSITFLFGKL
jgi:hypothetical protein